MAYEALIILPLASDLAGLSRAGGKGANLALLARAGFCVPPGFIICTSAYKEYVRANQLDSVLRAALGEVDASDLALLERASSAIRQVFAAGSLPEATRQHISHAYRELGNLPVAVRSSATAEDLPGFSFAGQQDTFLNVRSEDDLLRKVKECWSSLWTARAIGYRSRQDVAVDEVSIAVVVQQMVPSETSGVLFTANPLSGLRAECVIDATYGLGEGLVSGLVEPDHYVVDTVHNEIVLKQLGSKSVSVRPAEQGGVEQVNETGAGKQALSDDQILQLAAIGQQVQTLFGTPQDIEWAFSGGQLFLLQSRPVTSLFPLPEGVPAEPLKVFFSFGGVQGYLEPLTPIGQSAMKTLVAAIAGLFGLRATESTQTVLYSAGERLWGNFTSLLRNSLGRKVAPLALDYVEPAIGQAVRQILEDLRLQPERQGVSLKWRLRLAGFAIPLAGNVILNILSPAARRRMIVGNGERLLQEMAALASRLEGDRHEKLARLPELFGDFLRRRLPRTFILFVSGVAAGMASANGLNLLTKETPGGAATKKGWTELTQQVMRGMPNNPTTEMDLRLWQMAKRLRRDVDSSRAMVELPADELAERFLAGELPGALSAEIDQFLGKYGGRGFGEIDLGRPRWAEDPTHVFEMLSSFMQIEDTSKAPDMMFEQAARSAEAAVARIVSSLRTSRGGVMKSARARFLASRVRQLMGLRESPKFFAVRLEWVLRRELLRLGQEFVAAGELRQADDLCYLTFAELQEFAARKERDWHRMIAVRRETYQREQKRRQIPRLILSDGRTCYEGMNAPDGAKEGGLLGSPVSAGLVEGVVRVVLNPAEAGLLPGEIMVCPGTDPSWTPLFMAAGGLVMEVGGMMTHGAVVAREYGIPAVVGVTSATTTLKTGQRIRLNGSNGEITLLDV